MSTKSAVAALQKQLYAEAYAEALSNVREKVEQALASLGGGRKVGAAAGAKRGRPKGGGKRKRRTPAEQRKTAKEIAAYLKGGHTQKEAAKKFDISALTVGKYLKTFVKGWKGKRGKRKGGKKASKPAEAPAAAK